MLLNELSTYPKIPINLRETIEEKYNELMDSLYDRPYDALCWLEDTYQDTIDKGKNNNFNFTVVGDLILLRTYSRMLAIDCLTVERADNWDGWIDKIQDTPKVTEDEIANLRSMNREQIFEMFS